MNRLQQAGSLGRYISISIKGSSVTYFIEIWSHDRHLITWRHTQTCLRLGNGSVVFQTQIYITNAIKQVKPSIINGYLLKKGYFTFCWLTVSVQICKQSAIIWLTMIIGSCRITFFFSRIEYASFYFQCCQCITESVYSRSSNNGYVFFFFIHLI